MRRIVLTTAAACLMAGAAYAHALLDRASPAVGSEVSAPPSMLTLTYTEPVEPLFCTVHVTDDHGTEVEQGKPSVKDNGRTLVVALKKLPPSVYHVEWHVTSVDTHKTDGHFTFTVKP
jgi:methionine-rich copper-binding protein CopC